MMPKMGPCIVTSMERVQSRADYFAGGRFTASWTYNVATIRASNNTPSSYSGASFNVGKGQAARVNYLRRESGT